MPTTTAGAFVGAVVGTGATVTFTVGADVCFRVGLAVVEGGLGACVVVGWRVANTGAGVIFTVGASVLMIVGATVVVRGVGACVVGGWPTSTIFTSAQFQNCSAPL